MEGYVDHHAWLVNNNLLTDQMKDTIAMCGYCLVENVIDVETSIDFNKSTVIYNLLLPEQLYENLCLLRRFENGEKLGFFDSLKLKKFIKAKKRHDETGMGYKLEEIGNKFITSYLSDSWRVEVNLFGENGNKEQDFWLRDDGDKQVN